MPPFFRLLHRKVHRVLGAYNGEDLQWHAVTPAMGKPDFQSPEASAPLQRPSAADFFKPRKGQSTPAGPAMAKKGGAPTAAAQAAALNTDEKPEPEQKIKAEAEAEAAATPMAAPVKHEEKEAGQGSQGKSQRKRKAGQGLGAAAKSPGSSAQKKAMSKPPGQPNISQFFTKKG